MNNYSIRIEVAVSEIENIFKELNEAQEKIYECYRKLQDLGVVTISKADTPALEK